jgi:cysteinyl-tRNA synthetase
MPDLGAEGIEALRKAIREFDTVLGVLPVPKEPQSLDAEIEEQIRLRQEARQAKDFNKADIIRDELKVRGIILIDTPGGVTWKRE